MSGGSAESFDDQLVDEQWIDEEWIEDDDYAGWADQDYEDMYEEDDEDQYYEDQSGDVMYEDEFMSLSIDPEPVDDSEVRASKMLVAAVVANDPSASAMLIRQIPIDGDKIEEILDDLLVHAVNNNSVEAFRAILKYYEEYIKTIDLTSFTPRVKYVFKDMHKVVVRLSEYGLTASMMYDFLFNVIDDLGIDMIVTDLCRMKDDTSTGAMMLRLLKFYDIMTSADPETTLKRLQDIAEENDSLIVQETLRKYKRQMNVTLGIYAPGSEWILPVVKGNEPVLIDHVDVPLMDVDDIKEHYYDMVGKTDIAEDFNTPYDVDESSLRQLISEYQEEMSRGIFMRIINDTTIGKTLDRMLGPVHNNMRMTMHDDHICMRYGGCRMLVCNCVEGNDEEFGDDDDADWFKGQCDDCGLLIKNRRHAVRVPRDSGGWSGCYCSFSCLYARMYKDSFDDEIVAEMERRVKSSMIYDHIDATEVIETRLADGLTVESTLLMIE